MEKFAIFYNDGTVIYGGDEDDELVPVYFSKKWLEAPSDGVCCVAVDNASTGRTVFQQYEFYFQMPANGHGNGDIFASNKIGPFLRQSCNDGSLAKFGGWSSLPNYMDIISKARRDPWINPETGSGKEPEEDADL